MASREDPAAELAECRRRVDQLGRELAREVAARQRAESRLEEVFSVVSHRLRSPLAGLVGIAELLLEGQVPDAKRRSFLAHLSTEARRLAAFVGDFLDLQALESGNSPYDFRPLDLDEVLGPTVERFRRRHPARPFRLAVAAGLPTVAADRERLQQVLGLLLDNAVRYSPEGAEVRVAARRQGARAVIAIADRGIGIRKELRERVFERFFRVQEVAGQVPGAGLGLAIAARVVGDHGGEIRLESEPGTGSTFSVVLPSNAG